MSPGAASAMKSISSCSWHEVNHRSKNLLALCKAVARQTAASCPGDFVSRFGGASGRNGRGTGPARTRTNGGASISAGPCTLPTRALPGSRGTRIEIGGPPLLLSASAAQPLAWPSTSCDQCGEIRLAIQRHGAPRSEWSLEPAGEDCESFVMSWTGTGRPAPANPPAQALAGLSSAT